MPQYDDDWMAPLVDDPDTTWVVVEDNGPALVFRGFAAMEDWTKRELGLNRGIDPEEVAGWFAELSPWQREKDRFAQIRFEFRLYSGVSPFTVSYAVPGPALAAADPGAPPP